MIWFENFNGHRKKYEMRFSDCTFQAFGPKMFLLFHKSLIWNKPSALIFGGRSDSDFSWPRSQPHVCAVRVGSCRIVQRIRVKNVRGVEIKEPTCVPLPPTQRYYHKKKHQGTVANMWPDDLRSSIFKNRNEYKHKLKTLSVNDTDTNLPALARGPKVDDDHLSDIRQSCKL